MSRPLLKQEAQRLSELRGRANLTPQETVELNQLLARADAHEAALLAPSTRALEAKNRARESENRRLAALLNGEKTI